MPPISELKGLCKERDIKGFSGKSKGELMALLEEPKSDFLIYLAYRMIRDRNQK